jgi:hypothetical protein
MLLRLKGGVFEFTSANIFNPDNSTGNVIIVPGKLLVFTSDRRKYSG